MTAPSPQTIGSTLLDDIERHLIGDEDPTPFEFKRLEREAQKLVKVDPVNSYIVLAALDALKWDPESCLRNGFNAAKLKPNVNVFENSAISFRYVGEVAKAHELMEDAHKRFPANVEIAAEYVYWAAACGHLLKARDVFLAFQKKGMGLSEGLEILVQAANFAEHMGLNDAAISLQAAVGYRVLAINRIRPRGYEYRSQSVNGHNMLSFGISLLGNVSDEIRLEDELASLLGDLPDWDPNRLLIEFDADIAANVYPSK